MHGMQVGVQWCMCPSTCLSVKVDTLLIKINDISAAYPALG